MVIRIVLSVFVGSGLGLLGVGLLQIMYNTIPDSKKVQMTPIPLLDSLPTFFQEYPISMVAGGVILLGIVVRVVEMLEKNTKQ